MAIGRLFRRNRPPERAGTGPGSVTGRAPSGIHILSDTDDWVPPAVAGQRAQGEDERATTPSDWLPPGLPEPTSAPPPAARKRSTITEVPPELRAGAPEPDLKRTVEEMEAKVEEARREAERLRAEVEELQARSAQQPPADAAAVNVNSASVEELLALPGMTRRAAEQLVEYREEHGPFASVEALLEVPGFHAGRVERLGDRVTL